jgi:hypothetical protein
MFKKWWREKLKLIVGGIIVFHGIRGERGFT